MSVSLSLALAAASFGIGVSILGNLALRWLRVRYQHRPVLSTLEEADRQEIQQALIRRLDGELAKFVIGAMMEVRLHEHVDPDATHSQQELASVVESGLWLERIGCPVLYIALLVLMLALKFPVAILACIALLSASLTNTAVGVVRKRFGI